MGFFDKLHMPRLSKKEAIAVTEKETSYSDQFEQAANHTEILDAKIPTPDTEEAERARNIQEYGTVDAEEIRQIIAERVRNGYYTEY